MEEFGWGRVWAPTVAVAAAMAAPRCDPMDLVIQPSIS